MTDILLWLYLTNAVLLINHELDSACWKEWELFKLPGGIAGFLPLHFPLLAAILYGLVLAAFERSGGAYERRNRRGPGDLPGRGKDQDPPRPDKAQEGNGKEVRLLPRWTQRTRLRPQARHPDIPLKIMYPFLTLIRLLE